MTSRDNTMQKAAPAERADPQWSVHLAVLLLYAALTAVLTWPLLRQFGAAIPGDGFDGWQNYWNLWWVKQALIDRLQNPYHTDLLYAPTGVTLYFHTLNPLNALLTLPVQLAAGLIPAYNSVVLVSWVLAGYGMYLLAIWVLRPLPGRARIDPVGRGIAAVVAGAVYTFAPFHMAHLLGHMQVMSLQWLPFYALDLLAAMDRGRRGRPWLPRGLRAGLWLAFAGLSDWYFVLYLMLLTGFVVLWQSGQVLLQRRSAGTTLAELGAVLWPAVTAGSVFALLLWPLLLPMVQEARRFSFMVRPTSDLYILSASLADFLIPSRMHSLFRPESAAWAGNQIAPVSERTLAVGYTTLALAGVAVWRLRSRVAMWAVAALCFVLLAMGPSLHVGNITWDDVPQQADAYAPVTGWTPYALLTRLVPFMRISRSVSRFALMVQLCMAVLAAAGLASLLQRHGSARGRAVWGIGGLALALALVESWTAPYPMSPPDTPAYYEVLARDMGDGAILNLPMNYDRPGYLLYQTVHQRPLTVAYISRDDPRTLTERVPVLQHFRHLGPDILDIDPAAVGQTVLYDLGVSHVVLDRYKMPGGLEREYTTDLAAAIFAGQAPVFEDERITVYTVAVPDVPQPYLELGPLNWGPLVVAEDAVTRRLGDGPAELALRHVPAGTTLRLSYRTAPGVEIEVLEPALQTVLATLPPAPDGATVTLYLEDLATAAGMTAAPEVVAFAADGEAAIRELALELP